jgi:hypothetical protein
MVLPGRRLDGYAALSDGAARSMAMLLCSDGAAGSTAMLLYSDGVTEQKFLFFFYLATSTASLTRERKRMTNSSTRKSA